MHRARTPHGTHGADELNSHPPAIATGGAFTSLARSSLPTSLPVYQSETTHLSQSDLNNVRCRFAAGA